MKLPENIIKMLSSGNPEDIELGLFLALDFFDDRISYIQEIARVRSSIQDRIKSHKLARLVGWANYYDENKQYGKDTKKLTWTVNSTRELPLSSP